MSNKASKPMESVGSRPVEAGESESKDTTRPSPELKANVFSMLTWQWMQSMVILGNKRPLQLEDLYDMNPKESTAYLERLWKTAVDKRAQKGSPGAGSPHPNSRLSRFPPIWGILFAALGREYCLAPLYKPVWLTAVLAQVYVLKALVKIAERKDKGLPWWWATLLVLAMLVTSMAQSISQHTMLKISQKTGMKIRSIVALAVFDKVLEMKSVALAGTSSGQMLNLVTNDTQKLLDAATYFHFVWFALVELVVVAGFCIWEAGVSAIPGVILSFCTQPLLVWMAAAVGRLRRKAVECTDVRVRLVGDILAGIRVVKYNGWTSAFLRQVEDIRKKELHWIRKAAYLRAATSTIRDATTPLASLATFGMYVALHGGILDSSKAFAVLALFSLLVRVLSIAPLGIQFAWESLVAVQRFQKVLDMPTGDPELNRDDEASKEPCFAEKGTTFSWSLTDGLGEDPSVNSQSKRSSFDTRSFSLRRSASLRIEDETTRELQLQASVPDEVATLGFTLGNVHIRVSRGDLVAIIGPVGSGKSSVLLALLNEMHKVRGRFHTEKGVAYVPQIPWIFNATVRENVLFGSEYDEERYRKVIFACALEHDIAHFEAGDETEIGEKGINLSGGQRARISLARACYSSASLVFLDDPLAAVDVPTARHLMLHVLKGVLKGRTVILVTHNKTALHFCHQVYLMKNGQLQRLEEPDIARHTTIQPEEGQEQISQTAAGDVYGDDDSGMTEAVQHQHQNAISNPPENISTLESGALQNERSQGTVTEVEITEGETSRAGVLTVKEDRAEGVVTLSNYIAYLKGAGLSFCALVVALFLLGQAVRVMVDFWLGVWVDRKYNLKTYQYISVYAAFAVGALVLSLGRAIVFTQAAILSAKRLHDRMADKVFRSPQTFFDQNPAGRILNRFSKDQALVDDLLPNTAQQTFEYMVACLGTLVLVIVVIPWFLLVMPPFLIGFVLLQRFYVAISRELKRLEGTSRSPMYEHFAQTVAGAPSIRAYAVEARTHNRFVTLVDANHKAYILFVHAGRWLGVRLDLLAAMCVTMTALLVILLRKKLEAGLAGVVLVQSLQLTGFFQYGVRMAADTENYFTSVERIQAYATLPTEADPQTPPGVLTPDWPASGAIEFRDYTMAYREDLPPVLTSLSFKVEPQAKVGIMGRTGAGKSSLAAAIFRMVENKACHGNILVDGIDIKQVGLDDLRQRISIIPQDPVLFRGTVRMNLDPFSQHTDEEVNAALGSVHLKKKIQSLDTMVESNGENFSVGQRQLLCLARALLRKSRIIVMDEATAAVDSETDKLIQKTMREVFRECSVLTIAHRIETVIDSDLVLVLAKGGRIVEFDSPANLLRRAQDMAESGTTNPTHAQTELRSVFAEMVAQSGDDIARQLRQAAEAAEAIKLQDHSQS